MVCTFPSSINLRLLHQQFVQDSSGLTKGRKTLYEVKRVTVTSVFLKEVTVICVTLAKENHERIPFEDS